MRKRVALLSNNFRLSETLRLNLEDEGYDVIQFAGQEEDLKQIKEEEINLLIFDLDVPVWRTEFIKEAKRIRPILAVVLISSFEESLTRFMFNQIEIARTFIKPFELDDFSNSIKSFLDH